MGLGNCEERIGRPEGATLFYVPAAGRGIKEEGNGSQSEEREQGHVQIG